MNKEFEYERSGGCGGGRFQGRLLGDGGTMLAEMITAVDENAPLVYVLMNDQAYGVEVDMVAIGPFAESFSGPPTGAAGNKV